MLRTLKENVTFCIGIGLLTLLGDPVSPSRAAKLFATSSQGAVSTNEVFRFDVGGPAEEPTFEMAITVSSIDAPAGMVFSNSSELFVANRGGSVSRILNPGAVPTFNGTISSPAFAGPHFAAFRNGELFVAQRLSGNVLRFLFDASGNHSPNGTITVGLAAGAPRGVAVHPTTSELFVSECCGVNEINRYVFDDAGNALPNGVITGGGLSSPHDLIFSPWGELFAVNPGNNSISRFVFDALGNASSNGQISGNGLNGPVGLDFSPWGELFVPSHLEPLVSRWVFDDAGNAIPNGSFSTPNTVADVQFGPETDPVSCSVTLPIICEGGELSVTCQPVEFPETVVAGQAVVATAHDATWRAADTTCLGVGWHVTLIATDHLRGNVDPENHVIEVGLSHDFTVGCLDTEIVPIGDAGIPPTCPVGDQPIPLLGEPPLSLLTAGTGQGLGLFDFVPHFEILVPGSTIIDLYTTEILVDIVAGP